MQVFKLTLVALSSLCAGTIWAQQQDFAKCTPQSRKADAEKIAKKVVEELSITEFPFGEVLCSQNRESAHRFLVERLTDKSENRLPEHPKAVLLVGLLAQPGSAKFLIEYLESPKIPDFKPGSEKKLVSNDDFMARREVPLALGYIVNLTSSEADRRKALDYLRECADVSRWDLHWKSDYHKTDKDQYVYLTRKVFQGLGLSGLAEANATLLFAEQHVKRQLQNRRHPRGRSAQPAFVREITEDDLKDTLDTIQLAKLTNRAVRKTGLFRYYNN